MNDSTPLNGAVKSGPARPLPELDEVIIEKFISKRIVARRLGKTVRTIDSWMQRRLVPYYKIGHTVSFRWSEVAAQLEKLRVASLVIMPQAKRRKGKRRKARRRTAGRRTTRRRKTEDRRRKDRKTRKLENRKTRKRENKAVTE